jgi:hypothetical protein
MQTKQRITILLTTELHIRNFLDCGAFDTLLRNFDVSFLLPNTLLREQEKRFEGFTINWYAVDKQIEQKSEFASRVTCWRYRGKSKSFTYRHKRQYPNLIFKFFEKVRLLESTKNDFKPHKVTTRFDSQRRFGRINFCKILGMLTRNYKVAWEALKIRFLGSRIGYQYYYHQHVKKIKTNVSFANGLITSKPDLLILVSDAHDAIAIDAIRVSKSLGMLSVFLIDNWDNLSSKTVLTELPDFVATWGLQSSKHAIEIQGFLPEQVIELGSPRFQAYFDLRNSDIDSPFQFPYVLFLGTALPFNENMILEKLNSEIRENPLIYGSLKIVYRPHPWRQSNVAIHISSLENIVLDPQIANTILGEISLVGSKPISPSLDYYPGLLANSKFVVGGLTSMLLEASVFRKKYLALVHSEPLSLTNPARVYKSYVHFEELPILSNLTFSVKSKLINRNFREIFENCSSGIDLEIDRDLNYFIHSDEFSYAERLNSFILNITH